MNEPFSKISGKTWKVSEKNVSFFILFKKNLNGNVSENYEQQKFALFGFLI